MNLWTGLAAGFVGCALLVPLALALARLLCLYTLVWEGTCKVYTLFGKVIGIVDEPGLRLLWLRIGPQALLVPYFGKVHEVDTRLHQEYLRSQAVNSEEGTPMGIGVWYEMKVNEPVDYLFKNIDPIGSLRANVANATVRSLSNMPLSDLLENRHGMSRMVRTEVSPKSAEWGYHLGSIYIRKVHFRDHAMIRQIEQKISNRLVQVTSAIRQAGTNQVDVIKSAAEKEAATEFARAAAMRPYLVGQTLNTIAEDREVLSALLEVLQIQKVTRSKADLTLLPAGGRLLGDLLASEDASRARTGDGPADPPTTPPHLTAGMDRAPGPGQSTSGRS